MAETTLLQRIRSRPLETYNRKWMGGIAILVIAALIGAGLAFKMIGLGYRSYHAEFVQAASLKPGDYVSYAGVPVGNVTSTRLAGDHIEVGFRIHDNIHLRKDTRAAIKMTTLLGSQYLELRNGGDGPLSNRTIDLGHTEVPYDLQQTLADATTTYEQVDTDRIAASLTTLSDQLQGLPDVVPQAMHNIQTLSSIIARRRDQIGTLLESTEAVTNTLHRQQGDIGKLIIQGDDLLGEFVARRASFHSMMQAVTKLVGMLTKLVVHDRSQLGSLLANTKKFTDMVGQHDDLVRSVLQVMAVAARGVTNATGTGNTLEINVPEGILFDSWMCAISGRAKQFSMIEYFKDCK